ncbi:response regulator [Dongia sedimenti]|uniref:Winged helix-turn-helix domain-containing protein n=1 Tax=Dongia sedimenti TaxID=3064282 RepID=A0ABU0YRQ8_9PROT|nr:winged helix-turn-helix domain-containing protein [Rhodospirillaceae bacterium R-7]
MGGAWRCRATGRFPGCYDVLRNVTALEPAASLGQKEGMQHGKTILLVEDDREIGRLVCGLLSREGFSPRHVTSGFEMDSVLGEGSRNGKPINLVILDLMLPGEDGLSICRRLRAAGNLPILMLTAKKDDIDRIIGLEMGADDYLSKPFNPRELLARIRAILRRASPARLESSSPTPVPDPPPPSGVASLLPPPERLAFAGFIFDLGAHRLFRGEAEIELSTGDYEILVALARHPQRVLSRDQLLDLAKGRSWEAYDRSVDVALSRLRRKIEDDPTRPVLIKTIRNAGYMLAVPVERL